MCVPAKRTKSTPVALALCLYGRTVPADREPLENSKPSPTPLNVRIPGLRNSQNNNITVHDTQRMTGPVGWEPRNPDLRSALDCCYCCCQYLTRTNNLGQTVCFPPLFVASVSAGAAVAKSQEWILGSTDGGEAEVARGAGSGFSVAFCGSAKTRSSLLTAAMGLLSRMLGRAAR
uniref:Putative secreted peptide n=1 Tax=Anopheles braziliensis TaxID=58242 RepID=A0A2M3ZS98_9DIPT